MATERYDHRPAQPTGCLPPGQTRIAAHKCVAASDNLLSSGLYRRLRFCTGSCSVRLHGLGSRARARSRSYRRSGIARGYRPELTLPRRFLIFDYLQYNAHLRVLSNHFRKLVRPARLELATDRFEVWRSIHLSYGRNLLVYIHHV